MIKRHYDLLFRVIYLFFILQYLERELRMEGLPFPYSFEVCDVMELQGWVNYFCVMNAYTVIGFVVRVSVKDCGWWLHSTVYMPLLWCRVMNFNFLSVVKTINSNDFRYIVHLTDESFFTKQVQHNAYHK